MAAYFGWIVAAFLGGLLASGAMLRRRTSLMQNFSRVEHFTGRSFREIVNIAGRRPRCDVLTDEGRLATWRSAGYSITLSFDRYDICRGVIDEKY